MTRYMKLTQTKRKERKMHFYKFVRIIEENDPGWDRTDMIAAAPNTMVSYFKFRGDYRQDPDISKASHVIPLGFSEEETCSDDAIGIAVSITPDVCYVAYNADLFVTNEAGKTIHALRCSG